MFNVIKAPNKLPSNESHNFSVFLGGSIDMGAAEDWQTRLTNDIRFAWERWNNSAKNVMDFYMLNPRRDDWDSTWEQDPTPGTKFHEQVSWERAAQKNSDALIYYFADDSKSPITLLELGEYGRWDVVNRLVHVYCSPKFYRYGNVKMFCDDNDIPVHETYDDLIQALIGDMR